MNSRSCWWTGRPGVLKFMRSQRVGQNWATELNAAFLIHLTKSLKLVYTSSINSDLVWSNYKQYYVILVKLHTYRPCCARSCPTLCNTMDCSPLSTEFSRQEFWSGLPFPAPGDLTDPEIKPTSFNSLALASGFLTSIR